MDWTNSAISGFAVLLSIGSIVVAIGANRIAREALTESRRQHSLDIQPSLTVVTEPDDKRGRNYCRVRVQNSGPGVAHKVAVVLRWAALGSSAWGDRPVVGEAVSLAAQGRLVLPDEAPCTVTDRDRIWGKMTCEAGDGIAYWWQRVGPDSDWKSGIGSLPNDR